MVEGMEGEMEVMGINERFEWIEMKGYGWKGIVVEIMEREKKLMIIK